MSISSFPPQALETGLGICDKFFKSEKNSTLHFLISEYRDRKQENSIRLFAQNHKINKEDKDQRCRRNCGSSQSLAFWWWWVVAVTCTSAL